jgi:putative SOS response-associated peptidase YedK
MCGRFTRTADVEEVAEEFGLERIESSLEPSYNIAPTQNVAAIVQDDQKRLVTMRWGLIPSWAKDEAIGAKLINARAETVSEKPSFRTPFKRRRCLIIADGFFEWQKIGGEKQPFYIHLKSGKPYAFAGLFDVWDSPDESITSCTLITTEANELMQPIHERMPVILNREAADLWIATNQQEPKDLLDLLKPYPADLMEAYAVSKLVNSPRNNQPDCIEPLQPGRINQSATPASSGKLRLQPK